MSRHAIRSTIRSALILVGAAALVVVLMGNNDCSSAEKADAKRVNAQQEQYAVSQPVPWFDYSLERDVVIQLYQARQEKVATYTVWRGDTSVVEGHCPSIGYPIPYDTSLTNPLQGVGYHDAQTSIEQAEPNGLFSSKNSIATWVRCVYNISGKATEVPIYIESKVTAYPFPVKVNMQTGEVVPAFDEGAPSLVIEYQQ